MFLTFIPAKLHSSNPSRWYISYYILRPGTSKFIRKIIKLNRIKNKVLRKKIANKIINDINIKLNEGWNPLIEQEAAKGYFKLTEAISIFLKIKTKELRKDSIRSYSSYLSIFKSYLSNVLKNSDVFVINFDVNRATNFMQYVYNNRNISERVYNNYKAFFILFWNWLIENQYCKLNIFKHLSKKKEKEKIRKYVDVETRNRIKEYLINSNKKGFLAVCLLCYNCLLRPKEILMLKPENFLLEMKLIKVDAEISKTGKTRYATIPENLMNILYDLNIDKIRNEYYIFSDNFIPGKNLKDSRYISTFWNNIRKELHLSITLQFYSLKDSGITDMLKSGISTYAVKFQAGHSSLEMTNKYVQNIANKAEEEILQKMVEF